MPVMSITPAASLPWQTYRDVRLRALATNPEAFGSNSAREEAFDDARWIERASNPATFLWFPSEPSTTRSGGFLRADGLIGLLPAADYLDHPEADDVRETFGADAARLAFVIQMWVDPAQRGSGAFDALMDAVITHARATDNDVVALHVYRTNERAAAAYRRFGLVRVEHPSPECPPDEDEYLLRLP